MLNICFYAFTLMINNALLTYLYIHKSMPSFYQFMFNLLPFTFCALHSMLYLK